MSTIDKALRLLSQFSHDQPEFGLSELSRCSGQDKATTLRHARALMHSGLLEQDPISRRYRLGAEILRLANLREGLYPLRTLAHPLVAALSTQCQETVHLSARAGDTLGTVMAHESQHTLRVVMEPGLQIPWHATASGLSLLAHLPATEQVRLLELSRARHEARPSAPCSDDPEMEQQAIARARQRGYAVSSDRMEHGVSGVASAVFDNRNMAIATLAVALSTATLTDAREQELAEAVMETAGRLSTMLGATRQAGPEPLNAERAV